MIDIRDPNLWTAIGTVSMAIATFMVVLQGRRHRRDDAQRHQDSYKPICLLMPYYGVDPRHGRDSLLSNYGLQGAGPAFGVVEIRCALRNIGSGPAFNVGIMFRFLDMGGYTTQSWELSPFRAGESRGSQEEPLRVPIQLGPRFNQTDFSQIEGKQWEIIIVYEDIFGNHFYSVHRKRPAPSQPWVKFGRGRFSMAAD
jgi:hypothetical protein